MSCTVLMPRQWTEEEEGKHNVKMRVLIRQIRGENSTRAYLFRMDAVLTSFLRAFSMSSKEKCKIYKPFVANKKLHTNFNLVGVFVAFGCVRSHKLPLICHSSSLFLLFLPLRAHLLSFVHSFIVCFAPFTSSFCAFLLCLSLNDAFWLRNHGHGSNAISSSFSQYLHKFSH